MSECYEKKVCRTCGGESLTRVLSLPQTPPANELVTEPSTQRSYPLNVNQCESCGHAQLSHVVSANILFDDYLYVSGTSSIFRAHFKDYAEEIKDRFLNSSSDLIVEIGSNDGTLLSNFRGYRVLGIEPAKKIAEIAENLGVKTIVSYFNKDTINEIKNNYGYPRVVIANNVMAHIDNLDEVFEGIGLLLRTKGVLIFEVQYVSDLLEKGLFDMIYFEHVDYHALTPLLPLLKKHNLKIFDVQRVGTHGGSIRVFITSIENYTLETTENVKNLLNYEYEMKVNTKTPWIKLQSKIQETEKRLKSDLEDIKTSNQRLVIYGAPAKLTTFCYALGLGETDVDYVIDDNDLKIGKFTPGLHYKIRASTALYNDQLKPDIILVSAWNFAESIIAKHRNITCKWIVPFPTYKVIE